MKRSRAPRGYTLTELVMAGTLALAACLGGAQATRLAAKADRRTDSSKQVLAAVQRLETRVADPTERRCDLGNALDPAAASLDCARLQVAQETDVASGALPDKPSVHYRVLVAPEPQAPGMVRVRVLFHEDKAEVLRHAILLPLP